MIIAVDFDGTCVDHRYPKIGTEVGGAVEWLQKFTAAGAHLILWTMRDGAELAEAWKWFDDAGIPLFGSNNNPDQHSWTRSPKVYAHLYIDDSAFGCPLKEGPLPGSRPVVDWSVVGPAVMERIRSSKNG